MPPTTRHAARTSSRTHMRHRLGGGDSTATESAAAMPTSCFDVYLAEPGVDTAAHVHEDGSNNIVIFQEDHPSSAVCARRSFLWRALRDPTRVFYDCADVKGTDINRDTPEEELEPLRYVRVNMGDFNAIVPAAEARAVLTNPAQVWVLSSSTTRFTHTASHDAWFSNDGSWVSADHCQDGSDKTLSHLAPLHNSTTFDGPLWDGHNAVTAAFVPNGASKAVLRFAHVVVDADPRPVAAIAFTIDRSVPVAKSADGQILAWTALGGETIEMVVHDNIFSVKGVKCTPQEVADDDGSLASVMTVETNLPQEVEDAVVAWLMDGSATAYVSRETKSKTAGNYDGVAVTSEYGKKYKTGSRRAQVDKAKADLTVRLANPSVSAPPATNAPFILALTLDVGPDIEGGLTPQDFDRHADAPTIASAHDGMRVTVQAVPQDTDDEKSSALLEPAALLWLNRVEQDLPTTVKRPHRLDWQDEEEEGEEEEEDARPRRRRPSSRRPGEEGEEEV